MKLFNFWQKWILVSGILIILMGFTFPINLFLNIEFEYINKAFWENGKIPQDSIAFWNWIFGTYCALSIVFGIFIIFISANPFRRKEKWAWFCLLVCYSTWFLIDTIYSIGYKVFANASNNLILFLILIIPLIFTRKALFKK